MPLLQSWKESLSLLKWGNVKQLLLSVWNAWPSVYAGWFKYCFLALIACGAFVLLFIYALPYVITEALSYNALAGCVLVGIAILLSYATMVLYILIKQALEQKPQAPYSCLRHGLYGGGLLAVVYGALLYWLYEPMMNMIYQIYVTKNIYKEHVASMDPAKVEQFVAELKNISPALTLEDFTTIVPTEVAAHIKVLLFPLGAIHALVVVGMLLAVFLFLHGAPTVRALGSSIAAAVRLIIYNIPVFIIFALVIGALLIPVWLLTIEIIHFDMYRALYFDVNVLLALCVIGILMLPLCVTVYAGYVDKNFHE